MDIKKFKLYLDSSKLGLKRIIPDKEPIIFKKSILKKSTYKYEFYDFVPHNFSLPDFMKIITEYTVGNINLLEFCYTLGLVDTLDEKWTFDSEIKESLEIYLVDVESLLFDQIKLGMD